MFSEEERGELLKEFLSESRELLDEVEPQIIAMEKEAEATGEIDQEILNAIFRLFHSLKGAASFLDLPTIVKVTHEAETLLDIFRKGRARVAPQHVDLLCRTSDFIRNILDRVEQELTDAGFEDAAATIIADLQGTIRAVTTVEAPDAAAGTVEEPVASEESAAAPEASESFVISPEMWKRFADENLSLCDEAEAALLSLEKEPGNLDYARQAFRAVHSVKGNAGFFGCEDIERVAHHAEAVLDAIREGEKDADSVTVSFLLIAVDALREGLRQVASGMVLDIPGKEDLIRYLENMVQRTEGAPAAGGEAAPAPPRSVSVTGPPERRGSQEGTATRQAAGEPRRPKQAAPGERPLPAGEKVSSPPQQQAPVGGQQAGSVVQQAIRIDIEKLDKLLDLVGELVIAEAMVANNPDLAGLQLERFEKAILRLDKITREIQEVAMSMRMIPLAGTFRKMVRLVRDLAQKANKKVELEISGEETEVDKTIIEQIADPLVHMIRNAVDHGLETAAERRAAGKPEAGRITLEAKHSAGEVWIIVADDGRGLDREKIWRKALEKGLVSEDRVLKDEEVYRLIFEPGFSTAEQVTSISGRGVGMDVVKRNIEKLRGKVDIRTRPGQGTAFIIRIPLTLAIIEGMVVSVGANRYIIPISSIKESFQPQADQVTRTPDGLEVVRIRQELFSVIRLHEVFRIKPRSDQLTDGILIVVENEQRKYCLFVDELIGQQQIVIKGLSSYLGRVRGVSGCAILGDGDISMILDIADLVHSVEGMLR